MSMGKRKRDRQPAMWVTDLPTAASHPFYRRLNQVLREHGFDAFVEAQCAGFYAATMGRPSLPPGSRREDHQDACGGLYSASKRRMSFSNRFRSTTPAWVDAMRPRLSISSVTGRLAGNPNVL